MDFVPFPKIPRLKREVCVTEKIDGTNGQVNIRLAVDHMVDPFEIGIDTQVEVNGAQAYLRAGSRNRWLPNGTASGSDNFGFGAWVHQHAHELAKLGVGAHFGEWWGLGIGRVYGLTAERRFSLFNVARWGQPGQTPPACCSVVPLLFRGVEYDVSAIVEKLRTEGSVAAPGFMKPEGIIVWHSATRGYTKVTLDKDDEPKGLVKEAA